MGSSFGRSGWYVLLQMKGILRMTWRGGLRVDSTLICCGSKQRLCVKQDWLHYQKDSGRLFPTTDFGSRGLSPFLYGESLELGSGVTR